MKQHLYNEEDIKNMRSVIRNIITGNGSIEAFKINVAHNIRRNSNRQASPKLVQKRIIGAKNLINKMYAEIVEELKKEEQANG